MSDGTKRRSSKVDSGCSSASSGGRKFRYCRDKTARPEPIYEFLAKKFAYLSEEGWKDLINNGQHIDPASIGVANAATVTTPYVMVNTSVCTDPYYILQQQDLIGFVAPAALEPDVDEAFTVLYDDPCMIAVCKSGNIPVCTGGRYRHNTLERVVYSYLCAKQEENAAVAAVEATKPHPEDATNNVASTPLSPPPAIYPVHRLDKETSGVTVFAKTKGVSQRLAMLFGSKEEAIALNHTHIKDDTSNSTTINTISSDDATLLLQLSPYAHLHVGWRHAPVVDATTPPATTTTTAAEVSSHVMGTKRIRQEEEEEKRREGNGVVMEPTAASIPSTSSGVSLILKKEYSALVHTNTTPNMTSGSAAEIELPLDIKYRIGFAGEANPTSPPPADFAVGMEVVTPSTGTSETIITTTAVDSGPTAELSRKELKRQMWQLRSKKRVEDGVRTEMAEGSVAMANQANGISGSGGGCGGASSLQALHNPSAHASSSTTPSSSKFLNSMAMKCFPIDDISHGKDAHTRIHSITPFIHNDSDVLFKKVQCQIFTGRTHQIRCHLAAIGMPIVGDKLYSSTPASSSTHTEENDTTGSPLFPPYHPLDTPDDEQSFFGKCRGTVVVNACEEYQAVRHCLHAAKVTIPLGLLLGQYDTTPATHQEPSDVTTVAESSAATSAMSPLEALIRSALPTISTTNVGDGTTVEDNVRKLYAFEQLHTMKRGGDMVPVASLILDASCLAHFNSALVKTNSTD